MKIGSHPTYVSVVVLMRVLHAIIVVQWLELLGVADAMELHAAFQEAGVVVVPGCIAAAGAKKDAPCPYIRVSFSHASPDQLAEGVRRLRSVLEGRAAKSPSA